MCWMCLYRGDNATQQAVAACQQNEQRSGGHSWGVAVAVDGDLHRERGLGAMPDDVVDELPDADVALGHTRFATRGEVSLRNAHPFEVRDDDGDAVAMMAHNGTWWSAPDVDDRADSYYMARLMESIYRADPQRPFEEIVQATGHTTGETMTVLHRDGSAYVYAGRYEITEGDRCARSSGATPIREGTVTEI